MRFIRTFDEMIAVLVLMVKNLATYQTEVGATAASARVAGVSIKPRA